MGEPKGPCVPCTITNQTEVHQRNRYSRYRLLPIADDPWTAIACLMTTRKQFTRPQTTTDPWALQFINYPGDNGKVGKAKLQLVCHMATASEDIHQMRKHNCNVKWVYQAQLLGKATLCPPLWNFEYMECDQIETPPRVGTPASTIALFTSPIVTSRRWNIPAARAAAAWVFSNTSGKWAGLPAPLLAMTGIVNSRGH